MYVPIGNEFGLLDSIIVAVIAIAIVFMVLAFIIAISTIFSKIIVNIEKRKHIKPRKENKLLEEDEDAVIATIVASMDHYIETKKHARLVSITREEEE